MDNFKNIIRLLREEHFPGRSIRNLSEELEPYFGKHFYVYISKIEAGVLPSLDFVMKIRKAYSLNDMEYADLIRSYANQKLKTEIESDLERSGADIEIAKPLAFRKVKKKKL